MFSRAAVLGYLFRELRAWFDKRAGADTPEDDTWEVYTLLTFCDKNGPEKDRTLSVKWLNELCIASINSTKSSNNYRPALTTKLFREDILHSLETQGFIKKVMRPSTYRMLPHVFRNRVRYRLTGAGMHYLSEGLIENRGDFLYSKSSLRLSASKRHDAKNVVQVNMRKRDQMFNQVWDDTRDKILELEAKLEALRGIEQSTEEDGQSGKLNSHIGRLQADEEKDDLEKPDELEKLKDDLEKLRNYRIQLMMEIRTCADWVVHSYRDRPTPKIKPREETESGGESKVATSDVKKTEDPEPMYILEGRPQGVRVVAYAYFDRSRSDMLDQFVVTAGSEASYHEASSISPRYRELRAQLVDLEKVLVEYREENQKKYKFAYERSFSSPSQASSVVLGRVSSGPREWKYKDNPGQRLGDATQ